MTAFFDPYNATASELLKFQDLNESSVIKALSNNKLLVRFVSRLQQNSYLRDELNENFPNMRALFQCVENRMKTDSDEFKKISGMFFQNGIAFLLIKSDGSFPHESDNIDVLVKPEQLEDVIKILENAGYIELPKVRELNKYLFRQKSAFETLPLHIHTRVEWEGTQFVDTDELWQNSRMINDDKKFLAPSPEDCILITIAHLFFEDHEVKLYDLLKIHYQLENFKVDWAYMVRHSQRQCWDDVFVLTMLLLNQICRAIYNRDLIPSDVLSKLEGIDYVQNRLVKKIFNSGNFKMPPIKIPYFVSGLFFLGRIFKEPNRSLIMKTRHTVWVASEVAKLKINGPLI